MGEHDEVRKLYFVVIFFRGPETIYMEFLREEIRKPFKKRKSIADRCSVELNVI